MVEAIVSAVLVAVGVVSVLGAYGSLMNGQHRVIDTEAMQQLALDKYDELVATESLQSASLNGDFSDHGQDRFQWTASVEPTGVENLSALTVTVSPLSGGAGEPKVVLDGVVFIPPTTTGATP